MAQRSRSVLLLALFLLSASNEVILGQSLDTRSAQRLGLTPMWTISVPIGYGGRITGTTLFASAQDSFQAIDVVDKFGRTVSFSERDLSRAGTPVGVDELSRLSELREATWKARGLQPSLSTHTVADVTFYVRSSRGTISAFEAESGRRKWITQVGKDRYPNPAVGASDDYVVATSGSTLYVLDSLNGRILDSIRLRHGAAAGPTIFGNLIYAPTMNGVVEVYSPERLQHPTFTLGSSGRILHPLTLGPESVSWATDHGYVFVAAPGSPGLRYRFQSLADVASATTYADGKIFATSTDGLLYAIGERSGDVLWRLALGGSTTQSPMVANGKVFAITQQGELTCVDAESGNELWSSSGAGHLLATSATRLYCATESQLIVFDVASGNALGATPISGSSTPVVNMTTDRIFLVGRGTVQCLRENSARWPDVRLPPVVASPEDAQDKPSTQEAEIVDPVDSAPETDVPTADDVAADSDPFDDGGFDDASEDAGPIDDAADDDPFGDLGDDLDSGFDDDPFGEGI